MLADLQAGDHAGTFGFSPEDARTPHLLMKALLRKAYQEIMSNELNEQEKTFVQNIFQECVSLISIKVHELIVSQFAKLGG